MNAELLIQIATEFATKAHGDEKRKYTGEPYINHPISVSKIVSQYCMSTHIVCAALLHDVVEDTPVKNYQISDVFGERIAKLVEELTDVYTSEAFPKFNRKERKRLECLRLSKISYAAKCIKLADMIDNTISIVNNDPQFAKVYLPEKREILSVLKDSNAALWDEANRVLIWAETKLNQK